MTRVFIISDVPLYRMGLAQVLERDGRLRVVGTAGNWTDGLRAMRRLRAVTDAVLMDLGPQGIGDVPPIASALRWVPVVALIGCRDDETVVASTGTEGFCILSRGASLDELVRTVQDASPGRAARQHEQAPAGASDRRLTLRELEIIGLIEEGLSNKEIAGRLRIELPTVKNHVHHILRKLNASRRGQAAAMMRGGGSA